MTGPSALTPRRLGRSRATSAFRHRNYRLFFGGQAISLVGTWMQQVAQGWLVLQVSGGDPLWLGVVAAAQFVPVMVLGLFAGVLADSLPKRQTLLAVQVVMMTLAVILAVLTATGLINVWIIVLLAILLGCASAVDMPVRQSFAIEMVGPRDVGNAVSINSAMFNGARVVGPAIAGLTIGAFGIALAFAINAASFLAVIVALSMMRDEELHTPRLLPRPRSMSDVLENLVEGLRYVRQTPIVLMAVTVVGLVATFGMNFSVIVPPLAQDILDSDATGFGFLMTASGLGALVAAVWLVAAGKPRPSRIAAGALVLGLASIVLAASTSFPISLLLMVPIGAGGIVMAATANATIQLNVPDGLRGRVMSVYTTVFAASVPIGGLAAGALASTVGVLETVLIGGVLSLATGIGAFVWWRRIQAAKRAATAATTAEAAAEAGATTPGLAASTPTAAPLEAPAETSLETLPLTQSGAPNTRAAFNPPKPNEVLSTRR
ncbi:MAG TPA: MFS transporter [Candidatus Saccharimonadales bacterium]|nr:MFS transporter [Candidatus Saccharimonadales bacterium]